MSKNKPVKLSQEDNHFYQVRRKYVQELQMAYGLAAHGLNLYTVTMLQKPEYVAQGVDASKPYQITERGHIMTNFPEDPTVTPESEEIPADAVEVESEETSSGESEESKPEEASSESITTPDMDERSA